MTRPRKHDIKSELSDFDGDDTQDGPLGAVPIAYEDFQTGEWYDDPHPDGDLVNPDAVDPIAVFPYRDVGDIQRGAGDGGGADA